MITVQFSIWCNTVAEFPTKVREMGCNLTCAGFSLYQSILKECKIIKITIYANLGMSLLTSISFMPFIGDEAHFNLPEFLVEKYNPYGKGFIRVVNYSFIPLFGYTLLVPLFFCTHYVSHIKFQIMLLNGFLKKINEEGSILDGRYQKIVSKKLKLCVQLHNRIKRILEEVMVINNPLGILMIFVSTLLFVSAAYFIISNISTRSNFRMYLVLLAWSLIAVTFCTTAQRLTDQSEEVFLNAYNCPWVCWNKENRRTLVMLLANSLKPMNVTIYITETNHTLLLKLWRLGHATLTCLANVNKKK
ncbi:unnamed protein product [Psylliodes chrysocephalus]|nr:unnamed protein product [Psylliodes chrysocephala]